MIDLDDLTREQLDGRMKAIEVIEEYAYTWDRNWVNDTIKVTTRGYKSYEHMQLESKIQPYLYIIEEEWDRISGLTFCIYHWQKSLRPKQEASKTSR